MRLTRSGASTALAAIALIGVGRLLGLPELYAMGAAIGLLVVVCSAWVAVRGLDLVVRRQVRPHRVHADNPCTVDIEIRNHAARPTPVLRVLDPVTHTSGADLLLPPVDLRRAATAAYRLPTSRRGIVRVGPMTVEVTDPFGLARSRTQAAEAVEVTVLPRVVDIPPLPRSLGPDPDGATETGSLGRSGDEFAALRPYQVGDDLRRVHWPSSARSGDLLVRQHDVPWQGRVCVILDLRRQASDHDQLEAAVSAAASILRTHVRRGDHVRLVTTGGHDSGYGVGRGHLDSVLEHLAVVDHRTKGSLGAAVETANRGGSGAVVLVSGRPTPTDVEVLETRGTSLGLRRVVRFDESGQWTTGRRTDIVGVGGAQSFQQAWTAATAKLGRTRRRSIVRTQVPPRSPASSGP